MDDTMAIFDLDGTITRRDTYVDFLLFCLRKSPIRVFHAWHLPLAFVAFKLRLRTNSWLKERFLRAIIGGMEANKIRGWASEYIDGLLVENIKDKAVATIRGYKEAKQLVVLVTASFDIYSRELGARLGFDQVICTTAEQTSNGFLSGRISGANCYGEEKISRLNAMFSEQRSNYKVIAYTDHHSDLPLLEWADIPIVVDPTTSMKKIAQERNYKIVYW